MYLHVESTGYASLAAACTVSRINASLAFHYARLRFPEAASIASRLSRITIDFAGQQANLMGMRHRPICNDGPDLNTSGSQVKL